MTDQNIPTTYAVIDANRRVLATIFDSRAGDDPALLADIAAARAKANGYGWVEAPLGCAVGDLLDVEDGRGEVDEEERFEAIDLAREHIHATPYEDEGTWAYEDDGTHCIYLVDVVAMAKLGRMLRTPTASTYSVWCSDTAADEIDPVDIARAIADHRLQLGSFEPSDFEALDLDALRNEAASAGDLRTVAALDLARRRIEEALSEIANEQLIERRSRS
jgi:hypothetical protein